MARKTSPAPLSGAPVWRAGRPEEPTQWGPWPLRAPARRGEISRGHRYHQSEGQDTPWQAKTPIKWCELTRGGAGEEPQDEAERSAEDRPDQADTTPWPSLPGQGFCLVAPSDASMPSERRRRCHDRETPHANKAMRSIPNVSPAMERVSG